MARVPLRNDLAFALAYVPDATPGDLAQAVGCDPADVERTLGDCARRISTDPIRLAITDIGRRVAESAEDKQDASGGHGRYLTRGRR